MLKIKNNTLWFIIILYFSLLLIIFSCSPKIYMFSKHIKTAPCFSNIDFNEFYYDSENQTQFLIFNDTSNMYLLLKVFDETMQRQIIRNGLTVWIDIKDGKRKEIGINFPIKKTQKMFPPKMNGEMVLQNGQMVNDNKDFIMLTKFNEMELIGFYGKNTSKLLSSTIENEINGKIEFDEQHSMLYYMTIPMYRINNLGHLKSDGCFSIGIESGIDNNVSGTSAMNNGGMQGPPPGGGGMGKVGGGIYNENNNSFEDGMGGGGGQPERRDMPPPSSMSAQNNRNFKLWIRHIMLSF
ncbi:MAG: hypothetical protein A2X12_07755 [Bacteroidetes bacterium GWE2_29_8]|nr:MAG: hypothetical protein A2X12_07755 [Bacteroidetes bacterium GWE2_29_8]OFY20363.1 MAG: hypothetical protein A2X02_08910 [Bacteroidetes bacterium GWF2_29_10]